MTALDSKQTDFLYWHAVSKMRGGDFDAASVLFKLLHVVSPERHDVSLGYAYSLVRLGLHTAASAVVTDMRRKPLRPDEMALLGRLHRRCEFERLRAEQQNRHAAGENLAGQSRAAGLQRLPVRLPHTLDNDAMSSERLANKASGRAAQPSYGR